MASPEKPEYVLFMTPSCKWCNEIINKLKTKPELVKKFNVVNIDTLQAIPDEINEVPCIYDGKTVHQGKNAFSWVNEKMGEFLSAANDGLLYSFIDGTPEEQVFNNYSLLDQQNGSFGMGEQPSEKNMNDPTRMMKINDNESKNRTLDSLVASRSSDMQSFAPPKK
jgi:hypothetical protein